MRWLRSPITWFFLALAGLTAAGTAVLDRPLCHLLDEREWRWFARRNAWQSAFDALSVSCGVGLTTFDPDEEHTPTGRWVLVSLGLAGAVFYLLALRGLLARLAGALRVPSARAVLAGFVVWLALSVVFVAIVEQIAQRLVAWPASGGICGSVWRAVSAFASLGLLPGSPPPSLHWIYALISVAGGLGFWVWVLIRPAWRSASLPARRLAALLGGYLAFLTALATIVFVLEGPRGGRATRPEVQTLTGQPAGFRLVRAAVQTICAATSGIPCEDLRDRNVTDGTRAVLAVAVLVGPLGGACGGGISWVLLVSGLGPLLSAAAARRAVAQSLLAGADLDHARLAQAGLVCLVGACALTFIVACGLLVIESRIASAYRPAPTFAAALIDAASAAGGANLSAGLFQAVTDRNLSRGIRLSVDLYQYGACWLMLAVLAGRMLPLAALAWVSRRRPAERLA